MIINLTKDASVNNVTLTEMNKADYNNAMREWESQVSQACDNDSLPSIANELTTALRYSIPEYKQFAEKEANHDVEHMSMSSIFESKAKKILSMYAELIKTFKKPTNFTAPYSIISRAIRSVLEDYTDNSDAMRKIEKYSDMLQDVNHIEADKKIIKDALKTFFDTVGNNLARDYQMLKKKTPSTLFESKSIKESAEVSRDEMINTIWEAPYNTRVFEDVDATFEPTLCKYLNCTVDDLHSGENSGFDVEDALTELPDAELINCYNDYVSHVLSYLNMNNIHSLTDDDITFLKDLGIPVYDSYKFYDEEDAINTIDNVYFNNHDDKNYRIALSRIIRSCGANGYPVDGEFYGETYWDYEKALELIDVLNYINKKQVNESKSINEAISEDSLPNGWQKDERTLNRYTCHNDRFFASASISNSMADPRNIQTIIQIIDKVNPDNAQQKVDIVKISDVDTEWDNVLLNTIIKANNLMKELVEDEPFDESKSINEAANPENAEMNKMIANTIATKLHRTPKFKAELEAAGLKIIDNGWSTYNNWAVEGPNGKTVCLSKGRDNKPRIYNGPGSIASKDAVNAFDFVNYLCIDRTDRDDYIQHGGVGRTNGRAMIYHRDGSAIEPDYSPKSKTQQYLDLRKSEKDANNMISHYDRDIERAKEQIAKIQADIDRWAGYKSNERQKIIDKLNEIDTLLKSAGVRTESLMKLKVNEEYTVESDEYYPIAFRYLDSEIIDICGYARDNLKNMNEAELTSVVNACRKFYNEIDEIATDVKNRNS